MGAAARFTTTRAMTISEVAQLGGKLVLNAPAKATPRVNGHDFALIMGRRVAATRRSSGTAPEASTGANDAGAARVHLRGQYLMGEA
jgi:hypothetical protein